MLSGKHERDATGRCEECGERYPCRSATRLLIRQRDQQETDRLFANSVGQFESAEIAPVPGEVGTRRARLAEALKAAGAPAYVVWNARRGVYDHFRSTRANPHGENLTSDAKKLELWDIARRAQAGEFDAP